MTLASDLRNIVTAARPTVEEWIDIGEQFVGFRDACKAKGLDWGQIKALIKAQILDERDGGKRVGKIVEKADFASSYAAMLGLLPGKVNENNYSESLADSDDTPGAPDVAVAPTAMTASADQESAVPSPIVASSTPSDDDATPPRAGRSREQSPARGDIDISLPSFLDRKSPDCIANRAQGRG